MTKWRMNTKDFMFLLESEQDYKCALTGWDLSPDNFEIVARVKGRRSLANTALVHQDVAKLVKDLGFERAIEVCRAVVAGAGKS